ncbi:hypothetical protein GFL91_04720 [Rhizobium leguminosarum bv. viciae]|uniref:Rhodanese domain-containing protein n=1 Tax=Rhizobium leguminosarum bv. viciae TaxID=387 RepID=A0A8I2GQ78_RHILV|nr:hypothetical protein [Rhizobium leguminosarum]NKM44302.1 hypothetical protein [Rhizobium leguminosarum bv. viciae]
MAGAALIACAGSRDAASAAERFDDPVQISLDESRWCPASPLLQTPGLVTGPTDMARPAEGPDAFIRNMVVVRLEVRYDAVECDEGCRSKVSEILAQSLNLWRNLCLRCGQGLMAFVIDGDYVYLDHDLYVAWRDAPEGTVQGLLSATAALLRLDGSTPASGPHVAGSYVRVPARSNALQDVCKSDLGAFQSEWPGTLKSALCLKSPRTPTLHITFTRGWACGKESLIGCGSPEKEIAINAERFRFEDSSGQFEGSRFLLGNKASERVVDIRAALLHEIGHFLGVDHLPMDEFPNTNIEPVMTQTLEPGMCVSTADARMLNNVSDRNWTYRAKDCSGLEWR